ncbi:MAG: cell division protein FtsQ/DivIB [Xanthobacteraceae bacterium]
MKEVFASPPSLPAYLLPSDRGWPIAAIGTVSRRDRTWRGSLLVRLVVLLTVRGAGAGIALALLAAIGLYGTMLGGQYAAFVRSEGTIPDFLARTAGLGIDAVTIAGAHELSERQILDAIGIRRTNSLLFLDVAKLRDRLIALPLVKDASVSKLYPNRVMIEIEERQPYALWQKDGAVKIIAADGTPIPTLDETHFTKLPFVVGDGANARIGEYFSLLRAAGDLRGRIRAGILVAERRWTLKMDNGVEVALPEMGAAAAVAELARLQRRYHVLDKNIVALDLRFPGRLIARLPARTADPQQPKGSQT